MTKLQAFLSAIVLSVFFFWSLSWGLAPCPLTFLLLAGGCWAIWGYKYNRDQKIVTQAKAVQQVAASALPLLAVPPMTSPGSGRLFVPEPLDRTR